MRIGRFADTDNSWFWGLIDSEGEAVQRVAGDIDSWAEIAAAEDERGLPLTGLKEHVAIPLARARRPAWPCFRRRGGLSAFLAPGDLVEAEISGIGVLSNTVGQRST